MRYTFQPLPTWPREPTADRRRSPFRASHGKTLEDLGHELAMLGAHNAVIAAGWDERDLRRDGLPRANAKEPRHPGVIVYAEIESGPIAIGTDRFDSWRDNLRAVALALGDLRRIDRYGVAKAGEQYRGFQALPAGDGQGARVAGDAGAMEAVPDMTINEAIEVYFEACGGAISRHVLEIEPDRRADAYRQGAKRWHPDAPSGGDSFRWSRLQRAKAVLGGDKETG